MTEVFTTGQIAKICGVAPRTASMWIDKGLLKGWRIPGGQDRRVARADFLEFCARHSIPTDVLLFHERLSELASQTG